MSSFTDKVKAVFVGKEEEPEIPTMQSLALFKAVVNDDSSSDAIVEEDSDADMLQATAGSLRVSTEDIDFPTTDTISVYEVKKGDTLSTVAKLFGVSKNTIIWANDLKGQAISPGDTLVILPMTGIKHTIKKGDTVASLAKKYKADAGDIAKFNGVDEDAVLALGDTLLIPDGEITAVSPEKAKTSIKKTLTKSYLYTTPSGFLVRPLVGGRKTQGIHGHNAIDIAAKPGTPVVATANGRAIVVKLGGYNGGYGNLIIIAHDGGVQTVYAHLRTITITQGQTVTQGQVIGEVGNTGRSTGPHLHFEVRGAKNPF